MKTSQLLKNLAVIALFAAGLSVLFDAPFLICFAILVIAGAVQYMVRMSNNGVAMFEGLAPEVWLPLVKEDFYPSNSFLQGAEDMSALVDNDKINFAEAGADPTVMKNNTNYPVGVTEANDTPKSIELDYYDTDSTVVRNAIAVELAYDQRKIYADKHKKAMLKRLGMDAAHAYAPVSNDSSKFNTILNLGVNDSMIDAVIDLQKAYNECDDDGTERNLVLAPTHMAQISKEDKVLYKSMIAEPGSVFFGFRVWSYSKNPIYVTNDGITKAAQGTILVPGTHKVSSFSFLKSEVMKAQGTFKMFSALNDPAAKGDIFNFQMRALVSSLRGKYSGAILK